MSTDKAEDGGNEVRNKALIRATERGSIKDIEKELLAGARANYQDHIYGWTPLFIASREGNTEIVQLMLKHDADPNLSDNEGNTPLHIASSKGYAEVVQLLLTHAGVDPNIKNKMMTKETPLHIASRKGYTKVVELLLKYNGIDPKIGDSKDGNTPLHAASGKGQTEVVELLLKHGVDPSIRNQSEDTPLHVASNKGQTEVVKLLLERGVDPNTRNKQRQTPLCEASKEGRTEAVQVLLQHDADPNIGDQEYGNKPLFEASSKGHAEVVQVILTHTGVDPNIRDKFQNTPLHKASSKGHTGVVELLLTKYGADPNITDMHGETALHLASTGEVAECLIRHGANISALTDDTKRSALSKDGYSNSVIHSACKYGHTSAVMYFIDKVGLSLDALNKSNQTPIDVLKSPGDFLESQRRQDCLRQLIAKGYYKEPTDEHESEETTVLKKIKGGILKNLTDAASTLGTQPNGIIYTFATSGGAPVDLTTIIDTFEKDLKFAVYRVEGISELANVIKAAATLHYPVHCKHRCFYFAGYGGVQEKRPFFKPTDKDDEKPFFIREDILVHFEKKKAQRPDDKFIFFFDCSLSQSANDKTLAEVGFSLEAPAQCLVAHATANGGTEKGGQWTSTLCEHIKEQMELGEALAKAHDTVMKLSEGKQASQFISRIGPVYLKGPINAAFEKLKLENDAFSSQLKEKDEDLQKLKTSIYEEHEKSELLLSEKDKEKAALQQEMEEKITNITEELESVKRTIEQKNSLLSQLTLKTGEKDLEYERLKQDQAMKLDDKEREFHETKQQLMVELKALEKRVTDEMERYKLLQNEKNIISQEMKDMACRLNADDLYDVMLSTAYIQDQWEELGRVLRVPSSELERIKSMNHSLTRSHYETLRYWIVGVGASWMGLVDALKHKDILQNNLAAKIDSDYAKISQQRKRLMLVVKDRKLIRKYDELVPKYDIFSCVDWKVLGMVLGLDDDTLEQLDTSTNGNKARVMMDKWINTGQPYWSVLVDALESDIFDDINSDKLAKQIAKDELGIDSQARAADNGNLIEGTYDINDNVVEEMKKKILKKLTDAANALSPSQPKGIIYAIVMTEVKGAREDLANIINTFEKELKFAVYPVENISGAELAHLIKAAASFEYSEHAMRCKHICFYFAGHGGVKDKRPYFKFVTDKESGECFFIRENVLVHFGKKLRPTNNYKFIFFFDCCLSQATDDKTPAEVGFFLEAPVRCLIAYATAVGVKAFGDTEKGGRWTSALCEHLKEQVELGEVLAKTHDKVMQISEGRQPPQHRSCIGPVYFKGMPKIARAQNTVAEEESKNILRRHHSGLYETLHNNPTYLTSLATALSMDGIIDRSLELEVRRGQGKKVVVDKFLNRLEKEVDKYPIYLPKVIERMAHFEGLLCEIAKEMKKEASSDEDLATTTDLFQDLHKCKKENEILKQKLHRLEMEQKAEQQEQVLTSLKKSDTSLSKWKDNLIAFIQALN